MKKGWLDKMENGGEFIGLTNQGFDYNGAWGGPAQFGTSIPGSVGFTYARTGAPSNGKYAKKTMPSAQDGGRQKKISRAALDEILAPKSKNVKKETLTKPKESTSVTKPKFDLKKSLELKRQQQLEADRLRQGTFTQVEPQSGISKVWDVLSNPSTALSYAFKGERLPEYFGRGNLNPYDVPLSLYNPLEIVDTLYDTGSSFYEGNYQEGIKNALGAKYLPKYDKGGKIIKDDMGYWNPNNWGKPVEIDSNIITMEGVNQPLIGISDTGDTKIMQPGKNYKFKGKKVTELPMSKNGKELVKLDQLTNFTNYNTKQPGGWLDQY